MITALEQVTEGRLCWPEDRPRAAQRTGSPFRNTEVAKESRRIEEELERWRVHAWIMSRNHQRIFAGDPGAALWWTDRHRQLRVLACDKYLKLSDNMHAIWLTLDALRGVERWGAYTAEQAAEGARPALPPPSSTVDDEPWWIVLGVDRNWPLDAIEAIWRSKAEKAHPDRGGAPGAMARLNAAMDLARQAHDRP